MTSLELLPPTTYKVYPMTKIKDDAFFKKFNFLLEEFYGEQVIPNMSGAVISHLTQETDSNEYLFVMTETKTLYVQLSSLRSVSEIGGVIGAKYEIYHVVCKDRSINKIDLKEASILLSVLPCIPLVKTHALFIEEIEKVFKKYDISTFLDKDNLFYSLEQAKTLKNENLVEFIGKLIDEERKYHLRDKFAQAVDVQYNSLDDFYNAIRPIMSELNVPEKYVNHNFRDLLVRDIKGWDYAVADKLKLLAKVEDVLFKTELQRQAAKEDSSKPKSNEEWTNTEDSVSVSKTWVRLIVAACMIVGTLKYLVA
jgi:hypothetical protein